MRTAGIATYKTDKVIQLPHLIMRAVSGESIEEWVVRDYRLNPSFKADTFTK